MRDSRGPVEVPLTAKCADCHQVAALYGDGRCKSCAEKYQELQGRLKKELDHINEMRGKCQKKGEESLAKFIQDKCEEMGLSADGETVIEKMNVIVDLDGVLAYFDEWHGIDHIGDPIPGAQEFVEALAVKYNVIIFTTRTSTTVNKMEPNMHLPLVSKIIDWLEKHGFKKCSVWAGEGKPIGQYYIDDRAIPCVPQKDGRSAYWKVLLDVI